MYLCMPGPVTTLTDTCGYFTGTCLHVWRVYPAHAWIHGRFKRDMSGPVPSLTVTYYLCIPGPVTTLTDTCGFLTGKWLRPWFIEPGHAWIRDQSNPYLPAPMNFYRSALLAHLTGAYVTEQPPTASHLVRTERHGDILVASLEGHFKLNPTPADNRYGSNNIEVHKELIPQRSVKILFASEKNVRQHHSGGGLLPIFFIGSACHGLRSELCRSGNERQGEQMAWLEPACRKESLRVQASSQWLFTDVAESGAAASKRSLCYVSSESFIQAPTRNSKGCVGCGFCVKPWKLWHGHEARCV